MCSTQKAGLFFWIRQVRSAFSWRTQQIAAVLLKTFSISVVDSSSFTDPHYVLDNFKLDDEFIVTIVDKVPVTNQTEINSKTLTICGNRFDSELSTNNAFSVGFEVKFRSTESVHLVETKASAKNSTFEGIVPVSLKEFPSLRVYFVVGS
ncbi:hypothetical protein BLNAU_20528 [Blattamonas nauphoetae]|uniref:IPT/TIG domain-containing protein n=1 Tax=Blattamonas nauphoetae TaxID=2049346 RepID=A0ABQ9WQW0_9EUKA|nr:hypothetical protein BLNAU_23387 [Blattamonas nauphoetae]KAK2944574.1 hypothetical protein BLNAU_20528 [Blattamonas nauphoetae]